MTAIPRRIPSVALKVAALLSALAIATFLILRAQRGQEAPRTALPDLTDDDSLAVPLQPADRANVLELPAMLNSSKSLVIEPSNDGADKPSPTNGFDDFGLFSSKSGRLPSQPPPQPQPQPQQPKKQ
jgi:hypothetical protein